ncbi:hypothetical protein SCACP_40370 [Sporomusa carbonis]
MPKGTAKRSRPGGVRGGHINPEANSEGLLQQRRTSDNPRIYVQGAARRVQDIKRIIGWPPPLSWIGKG